MFLIKKVLLEFNCFFMGSNRDKPQCIIHNFYGGVFSNCRSAYLTDTTKSPGMFDGCLHQFFAGTFIPASRGNIHPENGGAVIYFLFCVTDILRHLQVPTIVFPICSILPPSTIYTDTCHD